MQYDIYISQSPNVFHEEDTEHGIWLDSCDELDIQSIEDLVKSRMRAICTDDDEFLDIVVRVYRE